MKYVIMTRPKFYGCTKWVDLGSYPTREEAQKHIDKLVADDIDFAVQMGTDSYMCEYAIREE